jgi:hypothetical protein
MGLNDRTSGRRGRFARILIASSLVGLAMAGVAAAQPYEQPANRRVAEVLPADLAAGPTYRVRDPVAADGYMYRFAVDSQFGAFDVVGSGALRKLVREIHAIAALREVKKSKAFATAVADSATGSLRFAKNLITNPVDTVSGVPRGAYKFMEESATVVTSERDPSDDPAYKKALLMSGRKREFAAQLGVDPYSSNAVMQKELNSVAWAAAAGNLTVSAALLPVGGTAGTVLTSVRWSNALNEHLKTEPANRLRIINQAKLETMGIPMDLATRFLDHRAFSPRHDTILVEALARLGGARGREQFLEAALAAEDEVDANFFTNMAQIMRGYHETVSPITEIQRVGGRLMIAQTRRGSALVALPVDSLLWTETVDRRVKEVKDQYRAAGFNGTLELWLTGKASARAKQRLSERGMTVVEEVQKRVEIID